MQTELKGRFPRVVITGVGTIAANANKEGPSEPLIGITELYKRVISGETNTGLLPPQLLDLMHNLTPQDNRVGAMFAEDFDPLSFIPSEVARKLKENRASSATKLGIAAAFQTLQSAGISHTNLITSDTGIAISSSTGPAELLESAYRLLLQRTLDLEEFREEKELERALFATTRNGLSDETVRVVAKALGINGHPINNVAACAGGVGNIFMAADAIRLGYARSMIAGGVETAKSNVWAETFRFAHVLATGFNDTPWLASRPGDIDRSGLVPSEMGAIVYLERLDDVLKADREDRILAEVLMMGGSIDPGGVALTNHITTTQAIQKALRQSSLAETGTDLILPHMTSTIAGDETEAQAILDANPNGIIFALKSITDHSFAAAGAVNIAIATQFLRDQMLPEQINLIQRGTRKGDHIDPGALSQVIFSDRSHAGPRKIETVAVHGIGMQGIIYVGVIRKYDQAFQL